MVAVNGKSTEAPRRRSSRAGQSRPEIVLCAGLKSSGSTWLYNLVIQILEATQGRKGAQGFRETIAAFYADGLRDFPVGTGRARYVVVKTHIPSASLQFLTQFSRGRIFITVREPRDAITSLIQRFDHRFSVCLKEVEAGAARLLELSSLENVAVFRYEDRFFDRPETAVEVAKFLGLRLQGAVLHDIFHSLTPDRVKRTIAQLQRKGVFGKSSDPNAFDPRTHWHPGHIGDGKTGKYPEVLSKKQERAVVAATYRFYNSFGYEAHP